MKAKQMFGRTFVMSKVVLMSYLLRGDQYEQDYHPSTLTVSLRGVLIEFNS